eukprot:1959087-Prymnesium_polylepis.1
MPCPCAPLNAVPPCASPARAGGRVAADGSHHVAEAARRVRQGQGGRGQLRGGGDGLRARAGHGFGRAAAAQPPGQAAARLRDRARDQVVAGRDA